MYTKKELKENFKMLDKKDKIYLKDKIKEIKLGLKNCKTNEDKLIFLQNFKNTL